MTSIELKTPWGDTVVLTNTGSFTVEKWSNHWLSRDRFSAFHHIGNWLNLEWWPTVFDRDWYQLKVEDISELPEKI